MKHETAMAIAGYEAHVMSFIHNRLGHSNWVTIGYKHHQEIVDRLEADGMILVKHHDTGRTTMRRTLDGAVAKMIATRMFDEEPLSDKCKLWVNQFGHHEYISRFPEATEPLMEGLTEAVERGLYLRGNDRHYRTFMGRHQWHQLTGNPRPLPPGEEPEEEFDYAEVAMF